MIVIYVILYFFFFKQKTAYEMRISNWSSDVCSSDLVGRPGLAEILPGQHVDPARAEQRPQRHLDGAGVGSRHDGDAVVLGDAEDSAVAVAHLVELRLAARRPVRAAEIGAAQHLRRPARTLDAGTGRELRTLRPRLRLFRSEEHTSD